MLQYSQWEIHNTYITYMLLALKRFQDIEMLKRMYMQEEGISLSRLTINMIEVNTNN